MVSISGIAMTAVLCDLRSGRIPNAVISVGLAMGLVTQFFSRGMLGVILFSGGAVLPVLMLGVLYYFRMIGAGDIKLLCVAGGFFGPVGGFACIVRSVFVAAVFSVVLLCRNRMLWQRLSYFWNYVTDYSADRRWRPYMAGIQENAKFCFSVPILIGILGAL